MTELDDPHRPFFRFAIEQRVYVREIGLPAQVIQRTDNGEGRRRYNVVYWTEGVRRDEWLLEFELSAELPAKREPYTNRPL